jgi:dihydrolipoamide dehydrogenase
MTESSLNKITMKYDVIVIGSGPGGYVCAIRCSQLGLKVAVIEKYPTLGGTCLNVGCIPSKALLDSSELFHLAGHTFSTHGIELENLRPNLAQMILRKNEVVKQTTDGIDYLFKKNKIDRYLGTGSFVEAGNPLKKVKIESPDGSVQTLEARKVVIATGSKPIQLPFVKTDKKRLITSTEALHLPEIPKQMILIGGGVIGLELGSVYARLGTKVTVVEYLDSLIPTMDRGLGRELQKSLTKLGFQFLLSHKVLEAIVVGDLVKVKIQNQKEEIQELEAD